MRLRLSFRNKIILAVALSVVGFSALGVVSIRTFRSLDAAVTRSRTTAEAVDGILGLLPRALVLERAARALTPDGAGGFAERTATAREDGTRAAAAVRALREADDLQDAADAVARKYGSFLDTLEAWVSVRKELGLDAASGLRGAFATGAAEMERGLQSADLQLALLQVRSLERDFFLTGDPALVARVKERADNLEMAINFQDSATAERLRPVLQRYVETFGRAAALTLEARDRERELDGALGDLEKAVAHTRDAARVAVETAGAAARGATRSAQGAVLAGCTAVAASLLAVLWWVGSPTIRRLHRTVNLLKDMATGDGDLTRRLPQQIEVCSDVFGCTHDDCPSFGIADPCWSHVGTLRLGADEPQCHQLRSGEVSDCVSCPVYERTRAQETDEFDRLAHWFNQFVDRVRHLVRQADVASQEVAATAEQLAAATAQIASGNEQMSAQASSVATGAEQMSATVQDVVRNTGLVTEAADTARRTATEGGEVIGRTVTSVQRIADEVEAASATVRALGEEAERIGTVVQMIEDIADQTNLLALNAAIEAARAGEHGRGFAVVADEVRKLAEKTVKATQEIGQTIASIQGESRRVVEAIDQGMETVAQGRELGERAGNAIHEIEGQVSSAAEQIQQIATATEELSATIRQMADNMEEIAVGTDQNTRAASEIAVTADALSKKAERLRDMTAEFQT